MDFLAHPFWDLYLEYEDRQDAQDKVFAILNRIIHIPMHQYARYFERHRTLAHARPLSELIPPEVEARYRAEVIAESVQYGVQKAEAEIERDIRAKIDAQFYEVFMRTQSEVSDRWAYEQELKQLYFHVNKVDNTQLIAWRKYLDFEENQGDHERIVFLYERCLVTCALYEEFWFRYARWMLAQGNKEEEVRNIYLRATIFVPISRPGIRLQFAYFEEMQGRIDIARDVHAAILEKLPDAAEVIISWANLQRRQSGLDAAIEIYKMQIDSPSVDIFTKAALVAEWAFLLWKIKGSIDEARTVFANNVQWYADSRQFWQKWLEFELEQPTNAETEAKQGERIGNVVREMRTKSRLSAAHKQELGQYYLTYLHQRGGKDAMKEFLTVDSEMFGLVSPANTRPTLRKYANLIPDLRRSRFSQRQRLLPKSPVCKPDQNSTRPLVSRLRPDSTPFTKSRWSPRSMRRTALSSIRALFSSFLVLLLALDGPTPG